jgi:hypothetical protein
LIPSLGLVGMMFEIESIRMMAMIKMEI